MVMIAHLADLHLGHMQYRYSFRETDVYDAVREAVEKIMREHVDAVVMSGDVFDNPRPYNRTILAFRDLVHPLSEKEIEIIIIRGDHDTPKSRDRGILDVASSFFPKIHELKLYRQPGDELTLEKNNEKIKFYGAPYLPPNIRRKGYTESFKKIDKENKNNEKRILIGHFPIKTFMFYEEGLEITELPRTIDYYALGHIHDRILEKWGKRIISYPGSIEIMDRKEINVWKKKGKGFYLVDLTSDEPYIHNINVNVRPQEIFDGEYKDIEEKIKEYLQQTLHKKKKPILHVDIICNKEEKDAIAKRMKKIIEDKAYLRLKLIEKQEKNKIEDIKKGTTEKEIITQIIGNQEMAELILELKNCLVKEEKCDNIIERILGQKKKHREKEKKTKKNEQGLTKYLF